MCSCGNTSPHTIMYRHTFDQVRAEVSYENGGFFLYVGGRCNHKKALSLPQAIYVANNVSLYVADETKELIRWARKINP